MIVAAGDEAHMQVDAHVPTNFPEFGSLSNSSTGSVTVVIGHLVFSQITSLNRSNEPFCGIINFKMSAAYKELPRIHYGVEIAEKAKSALERRVLMFDFERNALTNIKRGSLKKAIPFEDFTGVQVDEHDPRKLTVTFHKNRPYKIQAQTPDDRNNLWNLIRDIIHKRPPPPSDV